MKEIVVDIGNSKIKFGFFSKEKISKVYNFDEEISKKILKFSPEKIYAISVNRKNKKIFEDLLVKKLKYQVIFLEKKKDLFESEYSFENIGIDRFVSIYYAVKNKIYPSTIIDLGTADTCDYIDSSGKHLGGFISAGLQTISFALDKRTDKLFKVDIDSFDERIGKNTEEALKNGIFLQWLSGILTFISFGKKILGDPKIIITGGNSYLVKDYVKDSLLDREFLLKSIYEYGKDFYN
uniref:Type III pantothenate kinase n=1 Tax=candidate division WOR-3 bacterium TaxID=2052148 RepID=A0A7C3NCW2_UNCW3